MQKTRRFRNAVAALMLTGGAATALPATLTMVPMQGGMVMPMVAYEQATGRLRVTMPSETSQLTPLLVSNPGDSFDPEDPWYDALDPTRAGLSFSRRYGFVMDVMTDPIPIDTAIWIRRLSGSEQLGFYRYAGSEPKAWEPIFGTAGTPLAMEWSGMMFHPGVTALPGTEPLSATFEVYLANSGTGIEIADSASGPFLLEWTNIPDGRPALSIALQVVVAWPEDGGDYVLESADTLPAAEWTIVTNTPVMIDDRPSVVLAPTASTRFFRLRPAQ